MTADRPDLDATQRISDADLGVAFAAGQRVFGRFTLETEIGRGGMGVVWRARDEVLGEAVALKFLPASVARDAVAIDDLKDETRRARRLTHANIVRIHDFVQDAGTGAAAIAMELVEGTTLAELRLQQPGKVFSTDKLVPLVDQICAALDYAHTQPKVAHRDLKPANILVTAAGAAKIADFGIARSLSETQTRLTGSTKSGTSGTLLYMSPQQLRGQRAAAADDIYALGALLYELLAAKPPFYTGEITLQILRETPPSIADRRAALDVTGDPIPAGWEETILACLAKQEEERPAGAADVARRLGLGPEQRTRSREQANRAKSQPHRKLKWGLGAMAVAVALLAATFWPGTETKPPPVAASVSERKAVTPVASPPITGSRPSSELPGVATITSTARSAGEAVTPAPLRPPAGPQIGATPAPTVLPREFAVTIDPPAAGAQLWLGPRSDLAVPADGRALVRDLPDGEHELIVQAPGHQPYTTRVTVKDGRGSAEAKLVPVRGAVEIAARPGTVVTAIDARGREMRIGSVPPGGTLRSENLLTVGNYAFKLEHPDCAPVEAKGIELLIGRAARLAPAQSPLPGEMRVFSVPTGAEVRVNGTVLGRTPATLTNQPGETELAVEIYQRGYRRVAQTVTLKPREVRTINAGTLMAESGAIELRMADCGWMRV